MLSVGYKHNQRVVTRRGNHLQVMSKSTSAFFLMSPSADLHKKIRINLLALLKE